MPDWIEHLRREAAVIKAAPVSLAVTAILMVLLVFFVARGLYKENLDNAKELVNYYKEKSSISQLEPQEIQSLKQAWDKAEKTTVKGKVFRNEEVILDGFSYQDCEFYNVTLIFNGDAPFDLINNKFSGVFVKSNSPALNSLFLLLEELKFLNPDISVYWLNPPPPKNPSN